MLVLKQPLSKLSSSVRRIHASSRTCNLIASPDPISHMRPIIYDDAPLPPPPSRIRHPYSLSEFTAGGQNEAAVSELQYRLQRQQLDAFHHNFWLDVRPIHPVLTSGMNQSIFRATPVLKPPKKQSLRACQSQRRLSTKRKPSHSFMGNGIRRNWDEQTNTPPHGGSVTRLSSYSVRGLNTKNFPLGYPTFFRSKRRRHYDTQSM